LLASALASSALVVPLTMNQRIEIRLDAAFERIYVEWFPHVSRWVRTLGARSSDHEDLVQDVFTVAYRRLDDFDGGNIAGWLYQIARRKVRDYRRLFWVQHVQAYETPAFFDHPAEPRPGPLDDLETKQRSEALGRRLARLPSEQRAVFTLFELEGFSGHEIAQCAAEAQDSPLLAAEEACGRPPQGSLTNERGTPSAAPDAHERS
jgi:RNA polymerase sigma factor (sigma-70 family)